jgi:predicted dehydrogenase
MSIKLAIVGCGSISETHLKGLSKSEKIEVAALFDLNKQRVEDKAKKFNIPRVYNSWEEILSNPNIDAVDLCLPHRFHCPHTIESLESGKHVFVEKPISNTLQEADDMITTARKKQLKLMVGHMKRFDPNIRKMKQIIDNKDIGDIYLVRATCIVFPDIVFDRPWSLHHTEVGGGVTMGMGIHYVDLIRWLIGEVQSVSSYIGHKVIPQMEDEDSSVIIFKFANGAIGDMTLTLRWELEHFADCIENDKQPLVSGEEGKKALELVIASYLSAREGKSITLPLKEKNK